MTTPPTRNIGTSSTKPTRPADAIMSQLGNLLVKTLRDASTLEVRTYTISAADAGLTTSGDPLAENTRLRAFTRMTAW